MELLLGLGGNLGNVPATFAWAFAQLQQKMPILRCSSLYLTEPQGPPQPSFFNAVLLLSLHQHPLELLAFCQALEAQAGRHRQEEVRWGPRPLDLDLLLVPGVVLEHPQLQLPHPRLAQRPFALIPAAEVAPMFVHPRLHQPLSALASAFPAQGPACQRIGPFPIP